MQTYSRGSTQYINYIDLFTHTYTFYKYDEKSRFSIFLTKKLQFSLESDIEQRRGNWKEKLKIIKWQKKLDIFIVAKLVTTVFLLYDEPEPERYPL